MPPPTQTKKQASLVLIRFWDGGGAVGVDFINILDKAVRRGYSDEPPFIRTPLLSVIPYY